MSAVTRDLRLPLRRPRTLWRWALGLALLAALVAGAGLWMRATRMPISQLAITGTLRHVSAARIQHTAQPYAKAGFFGLDIDGLRRALEALPWVARARVSRRWPGALAIRVWEQKAVARWGDTGVMSADGSHFRVPPASLPENMPILHGPMGRAHDLLAEYRALRQPLAVAGFSLERLWIDPRGGWHAQLDNGLLLRLGRDHVGERMERFMTTASAALGAKMQQAKYVDLRYSNGFAVGWKAAAPQPPENRH